MCHESKISGMKLVFLRYVHEITEQGGECTPAKISREYNMTYRHILNIALEMLERKLIIRIIENWRVRYELTENGKRVLLS